MALPIICIWHFNNIINGVRFYLNKIRRKYFMINLWNEKFCIKKLISKMKNSHGQIKITHEFLREHIDGVVRLHREIYEKEYGYGEGFIDYVREGLIEFFEG